MANHSRVILEQPINQSGIAEDIAKIVTAKFPMFMVENDVDAQKFFVSCGAIETFLTQSIWLGETHEDSKPTIEFRNGHHPFMRWVRFEIQNGLARKYKAKLQDDGEIREPWQEDFKTYCEFLLFAYKDRSPEWQAGKGQVLYIEELMYLREVLPPTVQRLIGELPDQE